MNDDYQTHAKKVLEHNIDDFFVNGPGLRPRPHGIIALDPWKDGILLTGLGAMGVGTMWSRFDSFYRRDVTDAITGGAPVERAHDGLFGLSDSDHNGAIAALLDKHRPGWREWDYCPACGRVVTNDAVIVNGSVAHYDCYETIIDASQGIHP